jgi:hypothetical protein
MYQLNDCGYRKSRLLYQDTEKLVFPANMMLGLDSTVLPKAHEGNTRLNNKLHCKKARKCSQLRKLGERFATRPSTPLLDDVVSATT